MLETKRPREQAGRDAFSRYRAQIRSAAIAALSILESKSIDRVYCDLHDDFVVRQREVDGHSYLFYQVKTNSKQNHNWTLSELFGINSKSKDESKYTATDMKGSFIGKLLLHTVVFDENCNCVIFQTNINSHDQVESIAADIASEKFEDKYTRLLVDRFNECFEEDYSEADIKKRLTKLNFETDIEYLKTDYNGFESCVRDMIYRFSEIDLHKNELKEIILKLLNLVEEKSSGVIQNIDKESIEKLAGIQIHDLLSILSISQDAYGVLQSGGDEKAVKSASIIQRLLISAGGTDAEIEYCSRCKSGWDNWIRKNRHMLSELAFNSITQRVSALVYSSTAVVPALDLAELKIPIEKALEDFSIKGMKYDLNEDLLLGGIISELVRSRS